MEIDIVGIEDWLKVKQSERWKDYVARNTKLFLHEPNSPGADFPMG